MSLLGDITLNKLSLNNSRKNKTNNYINEFLKNSDSRDMTNDYSSTATDFEYEPTEKCKIYRMMIYIEDNSSMKYEDFGGITNGLTNGIRVWYKETSGSSKVYIDGGFAVKTNRDFAKLCYDVDIKTAGSGNNHFASRWTFANSGTLIYLNSGGSIGVTLNDDLSSLVQFEIVIQGFSFVG